MQTFRRGSTPVRFRSELSISMEIRTSVSGWNYCKEWRGISPQSCSSRSFLTPVILFTLKNHKKTLMQLNNSFRGKTQWIRISSKRLGVASTWAIPVLKIFFVEQSIISILHPYLCYHALLAHHLNHCFLPFHLHPKSPYRKVQEK